MRTKPPISLAHVDPHLVHHCLGKPLLPSKTAAITTMGHALFAQLRSKLPIGYNGAPHICHPNYPFPFTDFQTKLFAISLDLSDLPSQTTSISDWLFCHNALKRETHRPTDGIFDDYRPFSLYRERRCGLITIIFVGRTVEWRVQV